MPVSVGSEAEGRLSLTNKERVYASLEGKPVDRFPVTVLYNQLYYLDHFSELTGRPQWEFLKWCSAPVHVPIDA